MTTPFHDWSHQLQKICALERHTHDSLNERKFNQAWELLLEIEHCSRMARAWILEERKKDE
jgi:hypothetical protein